MSGLEIQNEGESPASKEGVPELVVEYSSLSLVFVPQVLQPISRERVRLPRYLVRPGPQSIDRALSRLSRRAPRDTNQILRFAA